MNRNFACDSNKIKLINMKLTSGWERKSEINSPQNIYVGIKKSHLKIENCKQESTTSE